MRFLAVDLGERRTGLAVGDDVTKIATPVAVIESANQDVHIRGIGLAVDEHDADALVVGLPMNMDGTEGGRANAARAVAKELGEQFGLVVHMVDERLSTYAADQQMSQSGLTHKAKKQRRDALAATAILQDFLDSR